MRNNLGVRKLSYFVAIFLLVVTPCFSSGEDHKRLSDDAIAQILINESLSHYSGNCPCPYNYASNGSSCGRRSAYSRRGGASPLCYKTDVPKEMIDRWRANNQ